MPFKPGHKFYPPKTDQPPSHIRAFRLAQRNLSVAVREFGGGAVAGLLVKFHVAVLCNVNPRFIQDEDDEWDVTWDDHGTPPTLEAKQVSAKYLSDRGWGQAAQQINLEADIRAQMAQVGTGVDRGALATYTPDQLAGMTDMLTRLLKPGEPEPEPGAQPDELRSDVDPDAE